MVRFEHDVADNAQLFSTSVGPRIRAHAKAQLNERVHYNEPRLLGCVCYLNVGQCDPWNDLIMGHDS